MTRLTSRITTSITRFRTLEPRNLTGLHVSAPFPIANSAVSARSLGLFLPAISNTKNWNRSFSTPSSKFQVSDPDYDSRIRASFAKQNAMTLFGASIARIAPGQVDLHLPFDMKLSQQHGFVHGGVVSAVLDSACGYAASTLMPAEAGILTIEFKINFLAPAQGKAFEFRGRVKKPGRTVSFVEGEAVAIGEDGKERIVATMTGTMMAIHGRENIRM